MSPLHKFSEADARRYIAVQHATYWDLLSRFCREYTHYAPPIVPSYQIVDSVFRHCGQFDPNANVCQYSIAYCVYEGEAYNETVAHELCHAMHCKVYKSKPAHGKDFLFLIRDICKFPKAQTTHNIPIGPVEQIANELIAARGGLRNDSAQRVKSLRERVADLNKRVQT